MLASSYLQRSPCYFKMCILPIPITRSLCTEHCVTEPRVFLLQSLLSNATFNVVYHGALTKPNHHRLCSHLDQSCRTTSSQIVLVKTLCVNNTISHSTSILTILCTHRTSNHLLSHVRYPYDCELDVTYQLTLRSISECVLRICNPHCPDLNCRLIVLTSSTC